MVTNGNQLRRQPWLPRLTSEAREELAAPARPSASRQALRSCGLGARCAVPQRLQKFPGGGGWHGGCGSGSGSCSVSLSPGPASPPRGPLARPLTPLCFLGRFSDRDIDRDPGAAAQVRAVWAGGGSEAVWGDTRHRPRVVEGCRAVGAVGLEAAGACSVPGARRALKRRAVGSIGASWGLAEPPLEPLMCKDWLRRGSAQLTEHWCYLCCREGKPPTNEPTLV